MGKKDENTGHVGQFADIVRKGNQDYETWQRNTKGMSEEEKWKSIINLRNLLMAVLIIILAIMTILKVNSIRKTTSSAYDILQKQRFVLVQDKNDWGKEWSTGVGFDLKDKELYNSYFAVIKRNKLYGGYGNYGTKEMYQRSFNREISSILVNLKISPDEIKRIIIKLHAHQIL